MSVRPCRPWWYHISGHYPCVYAEIETSKLNIRLQSTFKSAVATKFSCKFILHHVVNRALSTSHGKKFASFGRTSPTKSGLAGKAGRRKHPASGLLLCPAGHQPYILNNLFRHLPGNEHVPQSRVCSETFSRASHSVLYPSSLVQ